MQALHTKPHAVGLDPLAKPIRMWHSVTDPVCVRRLNSARYLHSQVFLSADSCVSRAEIRRAMIETIRIHDICDTYVKIGKKRITSLAFSDQFTPSREIPVVRKQSRAHNRGKCHEPRIRQRAAEAT
jgi:hypothetical protein